MRPTCVVIRSFAPRPWPILMHSFSSSWGTFLLLQTCCYQKCKRPNSQNRFGSTFGPDPALGGPVFTFRTACYYKSFAKSLHSKVQNKRSRGLCDFAASTAKVGIFPKPMWKGGALFCSFKHANPSCGGCKIAEPTVSFFWTPTSSDFAKDL